MRSFHSKSSKNRPKIIGFSIIFIYLLITFVLLKIDVSQLTFDLANTIYLFLALDFSNIPSSISGFIIDLVVGIGGFLFWVFFFSQFVLPVKEINERKKVPQRVLAFLGGNGNKGPAIFLQDGKQITSKEEKKRTGPGVILADSSSGAIIHNMGSFVGTVGPGLTFTNRGEKILSSVDLRTQKRSIGPLEGESLFGKPTKESQLSKNEEISQGMRKTQTIGLTRDGIEIIPSIEVTFKINALDGEGSTQFGFREDSVVKAIRNEAIVAGSESNGKAKTIPWDWLPAHLAANLWKEYLRKATLNEIFEISTRVPSPALDENQTTISPIEPTKTTYEQIVDDITNRLTKEKYHPLNSHGKPAENGQWEKSREFILLQNQGIKVISVRITNLQLQQEKQIIDRWKTTWEQRAKEEKSKIDEHNQILQQKAEDESIKSFAHQITSHLSQVPVKSSGKKKTPPNAKETLSHLLEATRRYVAGNPQRNNLLIDEKEGVENLLEKIKSQSND